MGTKPGAAHSALQLCRAPAPARLFLWGSRAADPSTGAAKSLVALVKAPAPGAALGENLCFLGRESDFNLHGLKIGTLVSATK